MFTTRILAKTRYNNRLCQLLFSLNKKAVVQTYIILRLIEMDQLFLSYIEVSNEFRR